jgi:outer membrane protein OmpA-like peptidoglycan-associated protein
MHCTRLVLLLSTVSIVALCASPVQARRQLVPDQPSVEVRIDALRALRQSTFETPVAPEPYTPSVAGRQSIPQNAPQSMPFGAPTPPPARPIYAEPAPQYTAPKVAAPKPKPVKVAKPALKPAPKIKEVIKEAPVVVAKAPAIPPVDIDKPKVETPKAPPVSITKPAPEIIVPEKPAVEKKVAEKKAVIAPPKPTLDLDDMDDFPPLEVVEENISGAPLEEFTLDDVAPEPLPEPEPEPAKVAKAPAKPEPKIEQKKADKVEKKAVSELPPSITLPEPDLEDLDFESFGADEPVAPKINLTKVDAPEVKLPEINTPAKDVKVKETAKVAAPKLPEINMPEPKMPEPTMPDLPLPEVDAPKAKVIAEKTLDDIAPAAPDVADLEKELAALDVDTPAVPPLDIAPDMPSLDMPEMPVMPSDDTVATPIPPEVPLIAPPVVKAEPKEEGLLPSLKKSFRSFLGGDEKKPAIAAPADLPPLPAISEAEKTVPPVAALPELSPDVPDIAAALPPLPETSAIDDAGLPPLPAFDDKTAITPPATKTKKSAKNELPPLPSFENPSQNEQDLFDTGSDVSGGLPPLPGLPMPESKKTEAAISSIVPDDLAAPKDQQLASLEAEPLPEMGSLDVIENTSNKNADLTVLFSQSETEVPLSYQQPLINLSKDLIADANTKVKVIAYASASDDQSSIAKRISLARALAVRAFLIDLGVDNVRISVQALGNEATSGSSERADVMILQN